MSTSVTIEQLKPVLEHAEGAFLISIAATAIIVYDYALTIDLEVQQIWKRDISGTTVLFILTRYITLLQRIFVLISLSPLHSLDACNIVSWFQAITTSILAVVMSSIAAVRVFALWNRDYRLFAAIMLAGLLPALANIYFRSASTVFLVPSNLFTCQSVPTAMSALTYKRLSVATRVISIFSDGLVVVLTWMKTYRTHVLTRGVDFRTNYSTLILRDGTLYFLAVCFLNVIAIVYVMNIGSNLLNDMIVALGSLLMSRFLLNLRDQRARNETQTFTTSMAFTSRPLSTIKLGSGWRASHSMAGSMLCDDADGDMDEDEDEDAKDPDLWRCDTNASVGTEATCVGSVGHMSKEHDGALVRGGKEAAWVEVL
ncbi:hypothetical protein BD309DRAFT_864231 [Dichomitus squalens]|uniref:Uncharacterized protein n=1 Tax=Dichomitus squalens TaxID=114155 RepID=A0A4V2K484_9APHY|nr:hypothetical protein BD309DRAFT_864231 [Dichomitus squalens]TBU60184.1 hypothetical protein BD310DRAFT_976120 [Dichomitus squalens]